MPDETILERARKLRKEATPAERALWAVLRDLRARGYPFRRQSRIGRYIADFACKASRLIVEVDGAQHGEPDEIAYDERRTALFAARGYRVLRFWNHEVLRERDRVVENILRELGPTRPASPDDLPMLGR